jgi:hypothetical protein
MARINKGSPYFVQIERGIALALSNLKAWRSVCEHWIRRHRPCKVAKCVLMDGYLDLFYGLCHFSHILERSMMALEHPKQGV